MILLKEIEVFLEKKRIEITCLSDLHGFLPKNLPSGDLLIVAGDLTARDTEKQIDEFGEWLAKQKYDLKVFIGGNHDGFLQKKFAPIECLDIIYLCDSGITYKDFKIWGSPWTPTFCNWHFMKDRGKEIRKMWDLIPKDTEILITHGPPMGILDQVEISSKAVHENHAGCEELRAVIEDLPKLKLHVFGHIHESYGEMILKRPGYGCENNIHCVNASIMDGHYNPINKPIRVVL